MCKVSVLVPICNVEKYLDQCLSSLAAQDMLELEIICLNDGSLDDSSKIAHKYERNDSRFRVIDKPNSGYGKTMNLGLSVAKGEYIGIVESDDFIENNMFSFLYDIAKNNDADVVKSAFWIHTNGSDVFCDVISDEWYDKVVSQEDTFEIFDLNPSIWSNLYKKSFLIENDISFSETPGASFQDIAWRTKVFASAERAVFTKKAFYHYRRDNVNASVRSNGKLFCVCDEYDEAERFLSSRDDWDDKYQYLIPYFRWGHYLWNCFDRWLTFDSQWNFYNHMCDEMIQYERNGRLHKEFWNKWSWIALQKLLDDPKQFFFDNCVMLWRKYIVMNGFFSVFDEAPKIAIYGAGKVGRAALDALRVHGKQIDCFVVSDMADNDDYVKGVRVRCVDELVLEQANYVILMATGMKAQPEILANLLDKGFTHVVSFMPEVRQALRV
ncbi:glycosyltransferase [Selenomonas caprae]|uniref:Glycosyltransferase n=1 Tax=Selenomonas caprae TaxID=2606905 RepID=A0A5D6WNJ1_9FIRM|nr:glycosyltransferase [Selenomonas caprae]TYZ27924.1 glycosyltransferase [Selenomonas caprae]